MSVDEALKHLQADKTKGLTTKEAENRLAKYGQNELESEPEKSLWARIAE
jgi:magnesium-transporting ATPase (P-type)